MAASFPIRDYSKDSDIYAPIMKLLLFFVFVLLTVPLSAQTWHTRKIADGGVIHRFFDTSPISPSGRYAALFRLPYEDHAPVAGDAGTVIVIDMVTGVEVFSVSTRGWEMQLGANVQWGCSDSELFYNDVDPDTWKPYAVCADIFTGKTERCPGTVFMVSPDGKKLLSYDLKKSRFAQAGYGVVVPDSEVSRNWGPVEDDGVYVTDLVTGHCRMIASIADIYRETVPSIAVENPEKYEYYCFQTKWNPQGTRILTTVQWTPPGGMRRRAVITMAPDGSDIRTAITPEQWARGGHHVNWMPDGEHLSMNLNIDDSPGPEIISVRYDGTQLKRLYGNGTGHPSADPSGLPYIVTDVYAGEMTVSDTLSPIRLIDLDRQIESCLAAVYLPPIGNFELRVDAHPSWTRNGGAVVFNGVENGHRCVYMITFDDKEF